VSGPDRVAAASPLGLLHPAGVVERVLVEGARCPASLLPPGAKPSLAGADLAIVAPSAAQIARRGWLSRSLSSAARGIAPDGFLYAVLPPGARAGARRRLLSAGLDLHGAVAQVPAGEPRYLLPLAPRPWRHMLRSEIGAHSRVRRGLLAAAALPAGDRLLAEALPGAAMIIRPRGAPPLAAWIRRLGGDVRPTEHVAVLTSWRGHAGPIVLFCFARGEDEPWGVAKLGSGSEHEARQLERLGGDARAAGARVPRLLATGAVAGRPVLVETAVGGHHAARVLDGASERFGMVAGRVVDWLERWSAATAQTAPLPADYLERELRLEELPSSYRDWLAGRCEALAGTAMPRVAAHHDLTMWNIRLGEAGGLGVLDWAEAEREALPLTDLFYALADAAAACDGYRSRAAAARSCFEPGGARAATVAPLTERLRARLGLSPEAVELCFHACWLRHAANEADRGSVPRPFAEIVSWLARRVSRS
jgi:hypothetical protein